MRVSDFPPLSPQTSGFSTAMPAHASPLLPGWLDGEPVHNGICIATDFNAASRGLGVEQHAQRVLECLCAESSDAA